MRNTFQTTFSAFKNLFDSKETPFELSLNDFHDRVKLGNDPLIEKIQKIRNPETTKEEKDRLKKSLLSICFSGTFNKRTDNDLIKHSGVFCADFDKYPNEETLLSERKRIEEDKHTLHCFRSPSGNGLKVLVRIPESDKHEHKRRFKAYEKYINSEYFDPACCNLSRVCFESYDPNAFINQLCDEFTEIAPQDGYKITELKKTDVTLTDDYKICEYLVEKWKHSTSFSDGERNNHIYKLAALCCTYGVAEDTAFNYIFNNVVIGGFSQRETENTVSSAYNRVPFGTEAFKDYEKENEISKLIRKGNTPQEIAIKTKVTEKQVIEIKEVIQNNFDTFWDIIKVKKGKKEEEKVIFEPFKIKGFLSQHGFRKYLPNEISDSQYLLIKQNKVKTVSRDYIITFMTDFVNPDKSDKGSQLVFNEFFNNSYRICSEDGLKKLVDNEKDFDKKILKDTKTNVFLLFKNKVINIAKNSIKEIDYIDLNKYVWEQRIIQRNFTPQENHTNDFQDFVSKICNKEPNRIKSLESTIGYLISNHKDKRYQKAVILNDQEINDTPNGGSGKSLLFYALQRFKNGVQLDGKVFSHQKSFNYSGITHETELMCFDDVKKNFNFEALFSLITEGIEIEQKGKDKFFIPFEDSPKIVITTNYVIKGSGGSHERRRHEVEFYQYFNAKKSPLDEYGKQLFNDWSTEEWVNFDNYMIANVQYFLSNGLIQVDSINADIKRFIQQTHEDFYDWAKDEDNLLEGARCYNNKTIRAFTDDNKGWEKTLTNKTFMSWVNNYSNFMDYKLEKGRDGIGRYFILSKEVDPYTENENSTTDFNHMEEIKVEF